MTKTHPTPWLARFAELGGYDCMTSAFYIKSGNRHVATIDLSDFGQKSCGEATDDMRNQGGELAELIVRAVNSHQALVEALEPLATSANAQIDVWKKEALRMRNIGGNDASAQSCADRWFKLFKQADAALKLAKGA